MDFFSQLAAGLGLIGAAWFAFRQYKRARLIPYARALQRTTLAVSTGIMENEENSLKVRMFAKNIALLSMSNRVVSTLGRDRTRIQESASRDEVTGDDVALNEQEKLTVQPLLHVFAMTCLLYDPKFSKQIQALWEEAMAHAVAKTSTAEVVPEPVRQPTARSATPARPVDEKINLVEDEILEAVSGFCAA